MLELSRTKFVKLIKCTRISSCYFIFTIQIDDKKCICFREKYAYHQRPFQLRFLCCISYFPHLLSPGFVQCTKRFPQTLLLIEIDTKQLLKQSAFHYILFELYMVQIKWSTTIGLVVIVIKRGTDLCVSATSLNRFVKKA